MPLDDALISQLPQDMNVDVDGKSVHIRETAFLKEAKDFPSFVKGAYDAHREVGARIPIKVDTSKPETVEAWRREHLPKLEKAGLIPIRPSDVSVYADVLKKPENIPDGLGWDDARAVRYGELALKHGLTPDTVKELLGFHLETLQGTQSILKTSYDDGMRALKEEFKDDYPKREATAGRLAAALFKNEEELRWAEDIGLANHPTFLSILMRLAPLVDQDSSVLTGLPSSKGGGVTGDAARKELADIMSNSENPKYKGYWTQDKEVMAYIDGLYKKAYGDAQVSLSGGLTAGGSS